MSSVTEADVREGLARLGLQGAKAEVHSSLSSFGHVVDGEHTIVSALTTSLSTILVPTFSSAAEADPPPDDRPARNGMDYSRVPHRSHTPAPFSPQSGAVDRNMGLISRTIAALPGAHHSGHPLNSWAAWGKDAEHLVADHHWSDPFLPVKRLAQLGGYILLLGVTLKRCSAIHVAEELAGRSLFVRWVVDPEGNTRRVRTAGDADGFDRIFSDVEDLLRVTHVGLSRVICAPLKPFLERVARLIREDAQATLCHPDCRACGDACAGGPID